ncbi:MAG: choice-of-anchor D domain-containing protein, partial [Candidatus Heimdallarchaeota archaeon]|nr:choice-of-anchor D domain-containing protein [Candidatus Heimdallarchaeota archaeon]
MGNFRAVDETGVQVDQVIINYPTMRASQGLAFGGTDFWYVERKTARCDLFKVAPDGTVLDSIFTASLGGPFYLGGAAWDGTGLWISVYYPNDDAALYKVDVTSKSIVDTIPTFGTQPAGITIKGDTLFYVMDDFEGDDEKIYAVNISTKDTLFSFPVPDPSGQAPKGLAWDGTYFWLLAEPVSGTGRQLFKYDLGGGGTPQIFVPITSIIFPNTTVGNDTSVVVQIFNNGSAELIVDSINVNGNVFSLDPVSFPLQISPGNSENITARFTPTDYSYYQGNLNIYSNDPVNQVVQVSLAGQGVLSGPVITLLPTSLNFGNVWIGEDGIAQRNFKIINKGDQTLDITGMQFNLPEFTFDSPSIPFQLASTDTQDVTVYFYPAEEGSYDDTLNISN